MFSDVDGRIASRSVKESKDEAEKEQKICEKFVQNRVGHLAKRIIQSE